ncbi:hypothetical protein [Lysobacter sp. CFH 32150]|uniref:hypothetical protein n=1 Tax=Lysobacter sp. CFH 32150 TaxID=2927128 RepID=UPI001FA815F2|nr:hypothetical protein [Lysobacter sp. CFH 32150]MCI4567979.1 hypothetical protein [Lysobacter sp. CFH 32150]
MNKLNSLQDRALALVSQVGDGLKQAVPDNAGKWLQTGAALGALKTGSRVATTFVRRHPVATVATVAGAGLLWYLARRRAQREMHEALEGSATRVTAKRVGSNGHGKSHSSAARSRKTPARSSEHEATT